MTRQLKILADSFTIENRLDMLSEECAELIVDCQHYKRGRINRDKIAEELADVLTCMKQVMYRLDICYEDLEKIGDRKVRRALSQRKQVL